MAKDTNVLVVDDDANLCRTLSDILAVKGYRPRAFHRAQAALAWAKEGAPAVALIDLRLDDLPGLELLKAIKGVSPGTECIVLTGHASQASAIEAINAGAYSYVLKPFDMDHLLLTIQRALERQETMAALQESEERYRSLFQRIPIGMYRTSADGWVLDANPALAEMLGYSSGASLRGINVSTGYADASDRQKWVAEMEQNGIVRDYDTLWIRADGTTLWVRESAVAIRDETGRVLYYEGAIQDISQRKEAEEHNRRLLEQQLIVNGLALTLGETTDLQRVFQTLYEHVRDLVDAQGFVVSFYDPATQNFHAAYAIHDGQELDVTALPPLSVQGQRCSALGQIIETGQPFYTPDVRRMDKETWTGANAPSDFCLPACLLLAGEPQEGVHSALCVPMKVEGQIVAVLQVHSARPDAYTPADIELLSALANVAAIAVQNARLFQDLQDQIRIQRDTQARLIQSEKMSAVGQLAGGVAHDFNNLLTIIHLSTRLLEKQLRPDDPLWPNVQRIQDAGQRAAALTRQLLSFSRKDMVETRRLNLNDIIQDLSKMLRRIISEDVELVLSLPEDLWPIDADPSRLDQVLMNVVVNARDAMPSGGVLTIETANVVLDEEHAARHLDARPGEHVLLTITDTGVGMEESVRAHIFEPFFTTKERGKGTGLGLATVYGIVTQSGGHVGVDSAPGQGTAFRIYWPRAQGATSDAQVAPSEKPQTARGSETILVAEDNDDVRNLMASILKGEGYRVLVAGNGIDALRLSRGHQGPIDLLLTDVVMPQMSGLELAEKVKEERPETRILYTSGYADEKIAHHGTLGQSMALLRKPISLDALIQKVRAVLDVRA